MSEENEQKMSIDKIKKILIAVVVVIVVAGGIYFTNNGVGGGDGSSTDSLDELVARDKKLSDDFMYVLLEEEVDKKKFSNVMDEVESYVKDVRKQVEDFVSLAKKIKVEDNEKFRDFLAREEKIKEIVDGSSECKSALAFLEAILSETDLKDKEKKRAVKAIETQCEVSEKFSIVEVKRPRDNTYTPYTYGNKVKYAEDDYETEENNIIPAGYSVITAEPDKGKKEEITLMYDGEERGTLEIVIKEEVKGKKVKGTGSSEDIAKLGGEVLDKLFSLWSSQEINASNILEHLSENNQNKAQEIESSYKKILFNWKRFDNYEPMFSQVSFKDYSNRNKNYPFVMSLPVVVGVDEADTPKLISFYYSTEKNKWVADYDTFRNMLEIVAKQSLVAKFTPDKFFYSDDGKCKGGRSFDIKKGVTIKNGGITGNNEFFIKPVDGTPESIVIGINGMDEDLPLPLSWYAVNLPLKAVDIINSNKLQSFLIREFIDKDVYYESDCVSNAETKVSFFE